MLDLLRENKLYAKASKCEFFTPQGVASSVTSCRVLGVSMEQEKVRAVMEWPVPTSVKDIRSFLGLAGYYRRFVAGFSRIAAPLSDLVKMDQPWVWGAEQQLAFDALKSGIVTGPTLLTPDESLPYTVSYGCIRVRRRCRPVPRPRQGIATHRIPE